MLFGDSITEQSSRLGGWGAALADTYTCKVLHLFILFCFSFSSGKDLMEMYSSVVSAFLFLMCQG